MNHENQTLVSEGEQHPNRKQQRWTTEKDAIVTQMWKEGKTARTIGETLGGHSGNSVSSRVKRLGVARPEGMKVAIDMSPEGIAARTEALRAHHDAQRAERERLAETCFGTPSKLEDLRGNQCHWPVGDPKTPEFRYCGADCEPNKYCSGHKKVAFRD